MNVETRTPLPRKRAIQSFICQRLNSVKSPIKFLLLEVSSSVFILRNFRYFSNNFFCRWSCFKCRHQWRLSSFKANAVLCWNVSHFYDACLLLFAVYCAAHADLMTSSFQRSFHRVGRKMWTKGEREVERFVWCPEDIHVNEMSSTLLECHGQMQTKHRKRSSQCQSPSWNILAPDALKCIIHIAYLLLIARRKHEIFHSLLCLRQQSKCAGRDEQLSWWKRAPHAEGQMWGAQGRRSSFGCLRVGKVFLCALLSSSY